MLSDNHNEVLMNQDQFKLRCEQYPPTPDDGYFLGTSPSFESFSKYSTRVDWKHRAQSLVRISDLLRSNYKRLC